MKRFWKSSALVALGICLGALGTIYSQTPATGRTPQFENDEVKVWKSLVIPNAPLTLHRHDHGRVIIALRGGSMNVVEQGGPTQSYRWETGKAYWLPANAPNTMHADVNTGKEPIEVMVVELKKDR